MLIVHDTDSIEDETTHLAGFSQSQTELRGPSMVADDVFRRHSCGAAEIGVILQQSEMSGLPQSGAIGHHMDDITAEVDEKEEYSNDFDEEEQKQGKALIEGFEGDMLSSAYAPEDHAD